MSDPSAGRSVVSKLLHVKGTRDVNRLDSRAVEYPIMIVVVAYGSERQLGACLDAVDGGQPVVVVDNGGSDEALRVCLAAGVSYTRPVGNIGFAAAVNLALRDHRAPGTDVLLLNPDAILLPDDLAAMRQEMHRRSELAAVGPQLIGQDGSAQKAQWPVPSPWMALAAVFGAADLLTRRQFVVGAALLMRGEAIDAVGNLDERFFLYAEEADWQLRAIRAGWRVGVVSAATAVHVGGGTSVDPGRRQLLFDASAERFVRKWYGTLGWQVFRAASIVAALRRLVASRDGQTRAAQRRSIGHYWRGPVRCADSVMGVV